MEFLQGKKTYIGIAVAFLGALGVFKYVSGGDLAAVLNTFAEFVGLAIAIYGRYKATPK